MTTNRKNSVYVPFSGGLSDGDAHEFVVDAPEAIVADNVVHSEVGAVTTAPALTFNDGFDGAGVVLKTRAGSWVFGDQAYTVASDNSIDAIPSSAVPVAYDTFSCPSAGSRAVSPCSASAPTGTTCVVLYDVDGDGCSISVHSADGLIISKSTILPTSYNPRIVCVRYEAGGAETSDAGWRFLIGYKRRSGAFTLEVIGTDGRSYGSGNLPTATFSGTYSNGWVLAEGAAYGRAIVSCLNSTDNAVETRYVNYEALTIVSTDSFTYDGPVIGGGSTVRGGPVVVVLDGPTAGGALVFTTAGVRHAVVSLTAEATGIRYNLAGVACEVGGTQCMIARTSIERDGTVAGPAGFTVTPTEAHLGDPRVYPALSATEATVIAGQHRLGTHVSIVSTQTGSVSSTFVVEGSGVLGNGIWRGARARFMFEWGFPAAKDNVGPSSGALTYDGRPFPVPAGVSTATWWGGVTFNQTTNPAVQRYRPTLHTSLWPVADDAMRVSLGASLLEQEGQAHYNNTAYNATCNFQEGKLGLLMDLDPDGTCVLGSAFMSGRISSRSNYTHTTIKGGRSLSQEASFMFSSNVDAVGASASGTVGLAITSCDLVEYAPGKASAAIVTSSQSYWGRNVNVVRFDTVCTPTAAADNENSMLSFGGALLSFGDGQMFPVVAPRPPHIALWNSQTISPSTTFAIQQRSSVQGDASGFVEHAFVYVRYRIRVPGGKHILSQLSPPLAVTCRIDNTYNWATEGKIYVESDATQITQFREYGPYVVGVSRVGGGSSTPKWFRRAVIVPAIPWLEDHQVELDVYVDDYTVDISAAKTGGGLWGGTTIATHTLSRTPAGQPRYVGTVQAYRPFAGAMSKWYGFYFGTNTPGTPLSYECSAFAPAAALGVSEPIASDALEVTPTVPATPVSIISSGDRIIVLAKDTRDEIWVSKPPIRGEAAQFSDELVAVVPPEGGAVVGAVAFEGRILVFKRDRVMSGVGDAPDALGNGGTLGELSLMTSEVGCISRGSILVTPLGVVFESQRGFCLVTPGGDIQFIGAKVSKLSGLRSPQNCVSSTINVVTGECLFAMSTDINSGDDPATVPYVLVWNYRVNRWSRLAFEENGSGVISLSSYGDEVMALVMDSDAASVVASLVPVEDAANELLGASTISTSWLKLAGPMGHFRCSRATVVGSLDDGAAANGDEVTIRSYVNYSETVDTEATYSLSEILSGRVLEAVLYPKTQKVKSIRFEVEILRDNGVESANSTAVVSLFGVQVDVATKSGSTKNSPSTSRG